MAPCTHTHTHTMLFTTLLCKFYSQLQLNGVCFVHRWHSQYTQPGTQYYWINFRVGKYCVRLNGEKRKRPKNRMEKAKMTTTQFSFAAVEALELNDSLDGWMFSSGKCADWRASSEMQAMLFTHISSSLSSPHSHHTSHADGIEIYPNEF